MARVLTLLEDGYIDYEFTGPAKVLKRAGHEVVVASSEKNKELESKQGSKVLSDLSYNEVRPEEFDALFLPGGRSPEKVRKDQKALEITKTFFNLNKLIAAICHGPQILASAGILKGKTITCWPAVIEEIETAGAKYVNQEVVIDDNLITSRNPGDVPAFSKAILSQLQ